MDPFALLVFSGLALLVLVLWLLGAHHPRSSNDLLARDVGRRYEQQMLAEVEDLDQMLALTNERRRRRGRPELTEHALHRRVAEDLTDAQRRREATLAAADLQELVDARNARRRKRGEPEMTVAEVRAEVERWHASSS